MVALHTARGAISGHLFGFPGHRAGAIKTGGFRWAECRTGIDTSAAQAQASLSCTRERGKRGFPVLRELAPDHGVVVAGSGRTSVQGSHLARRNDSTVQ